MSTSCVYPLPVADAFRFARLSGFDGLEIMVTAERGTQSAERLLELAHGWNLPILSIHSPVLAQTQHVWGVGAEGKLERAAELAVAVGATTVVTHPPYRWQPAYARRFEKATTRIAADYGVEIAVENMFDLKVGTSAVRVYAPSPDPTMLAVDGMTLDFSHAAVAGTDPLELALMMGKRLRHVHLCDAMSGGVLDEHRVPGRGTQPVAEVLRHLARSRWSGSIVAEIHTRGATNAERLAMLTETLAFARAAVLSGHRHKAQRSSSPDAANRE